MNSPLTPKPSASSTNEQVPLADVRLDTVGHLPSGPLEVDAKTHPAKNSPLLSA